MIQGKLYTADEVRKAMDVARIGAETIIKMIVERAYQELPEAEEQGLGEQVLEFSNHALDLYQDGMAMAIGFEEKKDGE